MLFSLTEEAALEFWAQLDCAHSLSLTILAKHGLWAEILQKTVDPEDFDDSQAFSKAYAACSFLRKNPAVEGATAASRKKAAEEAFLVSEAQCFKTNLRLTPYLISPNQDMMQAKFLRLARKILHDWLGSCPPEIASPELNLERQKLGYNKRLGLSDLSRHGPGTTFSSAIRNPTAADKYSESLTSTRGAVWYLFHIAGTLWSRELAENAKPLHDKVIFTQGNRFTTVPKDAVKDRGICIEASLNVYAQLGVGQALRRNLRKKTGWDLDNAAGIHRKMAQEASLLGHLATIDLSNASDTLAYRLVEYLFANTTWWGHLNDLRSSKTFFRGKWYLLEKFSSMGNGYTFELETLIFACLASAAIQAEGGSGILGHDLFVFGDDIIVPVNAAETVVAFLKWAGFTPNEKKTFLTGSFRESCGGDYFRGQAVRPYFLKKELVYGTQSAFSLHNGARPVLENCGINSPWFLGWVRSRCLPAGLRSFGGPTRLGDSVLHGVQAKWKWSYGIRWIRTIRWNDPITVDWRYWSSTVRLACRVTGVGGRHGIVSRGVKPTCVPEWVSDS